MKNINAAIIIKVFNRSGIKVATTAGADHAAGDALSSMEHFI